MRAVRVIVVIGLVTLLQLTLVAKWRFFGVHPEFSYCIPIAAGLLGGAQSGALVGFASGLVPILGSIFAASFSFLALLSFAFISAIIGTTPLSGIAWLPLLLVVPLSNGLAMLGIQPLLAWALASETRASSPW
ncbi:MAG: hypothetical protein NT160_05685 [Actinobacteria bacterium]|nr:hypothetical protein [Actinomycetota bacterium]